MIAVVMHVALGVAQVVSVPPQCLEMMAGPFEFGDLRVIVVDPVDELRVLRIIPSIALVIVVIRRSAVISVRMRGVAPRARPRRICGDSRNER